MRWGAICAVMAGLCAGGVGEPVAGAPEVTSSSLVPCADLPVGRLSDAELQSLVPDSSPGRVRLSWQTESQEETYGFNVLRSAGAEGPYKRVNQRIIPGEGTTNVRKAYCYEDTGAERGKVYYYQIEEVTSTGERSIVKGTEKARAVVKSVEEERAWLKKKALEAEKSAVGPAAQAP